MGTLRNEEIEVFALEAGALPTTLRGLPALSEGQKQTSCFAYTDISVQFLLGLSCFHRLLMTRQWVAPAPPHTSQAHLLSRFQHPHL